MIELFDAICQFIRMLIDATFRIGSHRIFAGGCSIRIIFLKPVPTPKSDHWHENKLPKDETRSVLEIDSNSLFGGDRAVYRVYVFEIVVDGDDERFSRR